MREITTRGGCRVKDARSPKRWGIIYVYITGHWFLISPGVQCTPGILHCDRSGLRAGRRWWHRGRTGWAVCRVVTLDFDILAAHSIAHCFDAIRRFLVHDDLLLHSRGLANHCLLVGLRHLDGAVGEVGILYSRARRCGTSIDRDALGMQRYILLHRCLDNEAADAGRAAVYEPLAGRSGGSAVRAKTKRGGALVDVDGVVPFQDFSNPIDMLVGNPDGHHRRAAFETAVIDGIVVVRHASEQAAPKSLPS